MDHVIYLVSPLCPFSGGIFLIVFMLLLGGVAALWVIFKRKEKPLPRIAMGCSSLILLLSSLGMAINFVLTFQNGDKAVIVHVNDKNIVESNCGDNVNIYTSYVLVSYAGTKHYDFTVAEEAYEKVEVESVYQFTYYPAQSLLGEYLQEQDYSDSYEAASTITRIEKVACP